MSAPWRNAIVAYDPAVPLDQLLAHPANPKIHPTAQTQALKGILGEVGWLDGLKVNVQTQHVLDGHDRIKAAMQAGQVTAPVFYVDVPADQEAYVLSTFDPVGALAGHDAALLAALLRDVQTGDAAVQALLDGLAADLAVLPMPGKGGDDFDSAPTDGAPLAQPGDIWQAGDHLLCCLDSTDPGAVAQAVGVLVPTFVWADPPYGVKAVGKDGRIGSDYSHNNTPGYERFDGYSANVYAPVIGDESTQTAHDAYTLLASLWPKARHVWWGANHYADVLPASSSWIVWDKQNDGDDFPDAELAWCNDKSAVRMFRHMWKGMLKASEVHDKRVHPTQKPVALAQWAFGKYGKAGDVIVDPFLGSGISLIAAHRLGDGRRVVGFELAPAYIDVCIARARAEGIGPIVRVGT